MHAAKWLLLRAPPAPYWIRSADFCGPKNVPFSILVEALTGLAAFEWGLVGAAFFAVILVLSSARRQSWEPRLVVVLAPLLAGLALLLFLGLRHHSETRDALSRIADQPAGLAVAAGVLFVVVAVTDFLSRVPSAAAKMLPPASLMSRWVPSFLLVLTLALAVAVTIGLVEKLRPPAQSAITVARNVSIRAIYRLPGHPTDVVFRGERDGYIAFAEGEIDHFELPDSPDGQLALDAVVHMLDQPRGLAIIGRHLFVSEIGRFPCPRRSLSCKWGDIPGLSPHAAEIRILKTATGRIVQFTIGRDRELTHERAVLSHLPVVSTEHAVNGMTAGPDARLYVAIGNVDALNDQLAKVKSIGLAKPNLLGTVVAVSPDGHPKVIARGLRNVYDLTFDDKGNLYGADNNGSTARGWRDEEVLMIRRGANYGYPQEGSFGPDRIQTDRPIWTLDTAGSAGIEWAGNLGLGAGLLLGSAGKIELLQLSNYGGVLLPPGPWADYTLARVPGNVTSIEPGPGHTAIASIYSVGDDSSLLQLHIGPP
jgi:hypothetical protein